jgi:protein SCO1/2
MRPVRAGTTMPAIPSDTWRRRVLTTALASLVPLALIGCSRFGPAFRGIDVTGAEYARDFSLTDPDGRRRTLADFRGRVVLLYFGFVQCPDVCPTALARAARVRELLGPRADAFQVVFVTVDPERDTPALLREYTAAFDPTFLALTGSADEIARVAREFRVFYQKVPTGGSYTMDHTALSYLFDRRGRIRVVLRHEQPAEDYLADVRALLDEPTT